MSVPGEGLWYVVQPQIDAEAKAARNLLRQGFEIYLPRYLKRRSHARKIEKVAAPLFPRYMFVSIDIATQRWRSVQSTYGVSHLVLNGSDPAPVAGPIIEQLKARERCQRICSSRPAPEIRNRREGPRARRCVRRESWIVRRDGRSRPRRDPA
jgi:transcription antitermination factor NusG